MTMFVSAIELEAQMPDATRLLSDEPEMESSLHYMQLLLLVSCLEWLWREKNDFFLAANLTIYYSRQQLKNKEFRGPDFFLVKDTERKPRNSWVVWEEDGRYPNLIIELLSDSTAKVDRGLKKELYQNRFRTPEYFWFSPETLEFQGFHLVGSEYQPIIANEQDWLWSQELGLYLGVCAGKLRYFTSEGDLVPTPQEDALAFQQEVERVQLEAQQAQQEVERVQLEAQQAQQEVERVQQKNLEVESQLLQEQRRSQRLIEQLRSLGINPDEVNFP